MTIKNFINWILDTLLPQKCIDCGKKGDLLCENCLSRIERCTDYLGEDTFALFSYENAIIRKAIKLLKYKGIRYMAPPIARLMHDMVLEQLSQMKMMAGDFGNGKILVIPVPLHGERMQARGFNQSEILSQKIFEKDLGNSFTIDTGSFKRIKNTESQVRAMNRQKRLVNLRGAFQVVDPQKIKGKIILLIDDVITTGATIEECRKTLLKAGAKKVFAAAIAH